MSNGLFELQGVIALLLGLVLFAMELFAFVDALRHRTDAYPAAGKLTKVAWCAITGVAAAVGILSLGNPLTIFSLLAVVGAAVYLADVRPALRQVVGRGGRGGRNDGPYGPW